jgi:hypothetical protein
MANEARTTRKKISKLRRWLLCVYRELKFKGSLDKTVQIIILKGGTKDDRKQGIHALAVGLKGGPRSTFKSTSVTKLISCDAKKALSKLIEYFGYTESACVAETINGSCPAEKWKQYFSSQLARK